MSRQNNTKQLLQFPYWQRIIKLVGDPITNRKYSQLEIAKHLDVQTNNLYRILYDLEKAGFIVRVEETGSEGKVVVVSLTARGRLVWQSLSKIELEMGYRIAGD